MRNFHLISNLAVVSLLAILSCSRDPAAKQSREEAPRQESSSATLVVSPVALPSTDVEAVFAVEPGSESAVAPGEESAVELGGQSPMEPAGDAVGQATNCSVVEFCNAPGSDGTRCRQRRCGQGAAENECKREARSVCGSARCPLVFVTSGKTNKRLGCPPTVCSSGGIECGGRCCGSNAEFCDRNNKCCSCGQAGCPQC